MSPPLVEQGDTEEGYLPRGQCEMLMAGAAYAVSEAVYAFPEGSSKREWGDWVEHMSSIVKGVFKQVKRIAKDDKRAGVSFVPFILWNFLQLHSSYSEDSVAFDLSTVLVHDPTSIPKGVKTYKLRACHGHQHFVVDVAWMAECITTWNDRRKANGWPTLELDQTPYKGRYILRSQEATDTDRDLPSQPSLLASKALLDEAQLRLLKRRRQDKGKAVDRTETTPKPSSSRGRSHEPRKLSGSNRDEPAAQADDASRSSTSTSSHRRSSRHRTPSRAPIPQIVSRSSESPPSKRAKTTKSVTIDLTIETRSRSRSRSRPRVDPKPKPILKSSTTTASTSAAIPLTANQSKALSSLLRDILPGRLVMNNKSSILWKGFLLLPPNFWLHIPKDKRLDLFQQAFVACNHCAIAYFPCYRQLGVAVACVRCRAMHMQCSLTFRKDGSNIENPYAHMLGRYMLCWQIHRWEHEHELIFAYRDFTDCSLMPGVPLKFMPGMRAGKSKEKEAVANARHVQLSDLNGWERYWHGAEYTATARTWRFINSGAKGSEGVALKHTPQFGELLPENIQEDLDSYYSKLLDSDPNFKLDSSDSEDEDEDEDADDGEDLSVAGSDTASIVRVEDDLSGDVEEEDDAYDMDEFDNDDTIVVHSGNTSLVGDEPLDADDNTPTGDRSPPPADGSLSPIDNVLQSIDTLPPTNDIPPPTNNVFPPIHDSSSLIDNTHLPAEDVDDVLTPIDDIPSPINVDAPPLTNAAPPPTDDVGTVLAHIDVDAPPLTNDDPSLLDDVDDVLTPIDDIPSLIGGDVPPLMNVDTSPANDIPPPVPSQEDVVMHEPNQDAEVDPNALTLSDIIVFPTSPPRPTTATSDNVPICENHGADVSSSECIASISTFVQPDTKPRHENQPLPTSGRLSPHQVPHPSHDLADQAKGPPGESEVEELQRLRKAIPELTEEVVSQRRLVAVLRERIATIEHKQEQTQEHLDAVNEELETTKLQSDLLREQSTSAVHAALATIVGQMGSLQESQTRAIHSAVLFSVDTVLHNAVQSFLTATSTSTSTSTPAAGGTLPRPPTLFSLSPNRSVRRPNSNAFSHHSERPLTAAIIDPASTSVDPSISSSITSSSIVTTRFTGPVDNVGDTSGNNTDDS